MVRLSMIAFCKEQKRYTTCLRIGANKMKRPAKAVFEELASKHDLLKDDGSVNMSAFSRRTDIPVTTIARILSADDHWRINAATVSKLMKAFSITHEQDNGRSIYNR